MNRAGFDTLHRGHYQQVFGLCRRMLGSSPDAEDAAQEVFMRGYRAIGAYRADEPFGPWIRAIATNYCLDLLRRQKRLAGAFSADSGDPEMLPDPTANGVAVLISAYDAARVSRAVDALQERYRLPIVLAYYAEAGYEEIADSLGITANHVGVLLVRARAQLRRILAAECVVDSGIRRCHETN